ncbi:MAG: ABC transporter ATP-binding protein [Nitrospirae bacterium]|nr:ABC transporter ATP-binding protein [Nitrospirota bacterium]MBF0533570.1 ABC transporter ATP-binding protein [Nitrospirota bacterium]MBF0618013.1 ABC transporter ATP-binding protein [Nitrospirota bacterium]
MNTLAYKGSTVLTENAHIPGDFASELSDCQSEETAIRAVGISKVYKLYKRKLDRLKESLHPFRKKYHVDFYALRDVSFELKKGQTIGIIGKNGAGKSTLLQVLTGVLTPTTGVVYRTGRISALLELGAGFNPELTGLENVYFNSTLMGYSKKEIDEKIDDIVSFAEIGDFADQAVKTYSSGMFVRLAFAVAINIDPDILIVDEALSVGDIRFQQKCFRRFREFKEQGKSIIFVSHDMGAVKNFCDIAVWLKDGSIHHFGDPILVSKHYFSFMCYDSLTTGDDTTKETQTIDTKSDTSENDSMWEDVSGYSSFGEGGAEIERVTLINRKTGERVDALNGGEDVCFIVEGRATQPIAHPGIGIILKDIYGNFMFTVNNYMYNISIKPLNPSDKIRVEFNFVFPKLKNGHYTFTASISDGTLETHIQNHWVHDAYLVRLVNNDIRYKMGCYVILDDVDMKVDFK